MEPNGYEIGRVLVAIDGSSSASRATRVAANIARSHGAKLTVMHVLRPPNYPVPHAYGLHSVIPPGLYREIAESAREEGERVIGKAVSAARELGADASVKLVENSGSVAEEIVKQAEKENADLIAVGTRGRSRIKQLFLGSTSTEVIRRAPCPVLVVN